MKVVRRALAIIAITAMGPASAAFEDYVESSLESVLTRSAPPETDPYLQHPGDKYFEMSRVVGKTAITYLGQTRPIAPERKAFVLQYFVARQMAGSANLYKQEILCAEGVRKYWLPIQQPVMEFFLKEVPAHSGVTLFVSYLGAFRAGSGELTNVGVVNDFQRP